MHNLNINIKIQKQTLLTKSKSQEVGQNNLSSSRKLK